MESTRLPIYDHWYGYVLDNERHAVGYWDRETGVTERFDDVQEETVLETIQEETDLEIAAEQELEANNSDCDISGGGDE